MPETEKLTRKEKRLRWKEAKRARRQAEKDYYRYAPWLKRVWNLYLKKPCGTIIVLAVIIGLLSSLFPAFLQETVVPLLYAFNSANKDTPLKALRDFTSRCRGCCPHRRPAPRR